jgi:hypothetical protein
MRPGATDSTARRSRSFRLEIQLAADAEQTVALYESLV